MNKRKLGRTSLHVSELCFNATKFGFVHDEASSFALLDTYYSSGGRFIQSLGSVSRLAGPQLLENDSEKIVGNWHVARGINRDHVVLASRINFLRPIHGGAISFANHIREMCERSLRRLRTQHLDLLICEWDADLVPVQDVLEAVDMLIRAGLVRYVVASNFPPWRVVDTIHRSSMRNHARFEAIQGEYSLMARARFEPEALSMCHEHRLGFLASSPLAGGFLGQRPLSIRELFNLDRDWRSERFGNPIGDSVLRVLAEIADAREVTPAHVALAWVLRNSHVTSAVISASTSHEMRELSSATQIVLSAEEAGALVDATTVQEPSMELRHI